jgi:hypothetical protein
MFTKKNIFASANAYCNGNIFLNYVGTVKSKTKKGISYEDFKFLENELKDILIKKYPKCMHQDVVILSVSQLERK